MLPAEAAAFETSRRTYGDISVLPTHAYLYGLQTGSTEVIDIAAGQQMFGERVSHCVCHLHPQLRQMYCRDACPSSGAARPLLPAARGEGNSESVLRETPRKIAMPKRFPLPVHRTGRGWPKAG